MDCEVGVLEGKELLLYSFPSPHPFTNERARLFWEVLARDGHPVNHIRPQKGGHDLIGLFHAPEHIRFVELASNLGYGALDRGDTPAYRGIFEATQYVVGSTVFAVDKVMKGDVDHAFNPVGGLHHATRDSSAGFCVFNDIGVAIEVLRKSYGLRRILYVDIDVHHGDGVFYSYESDPELFIFDLHEDGRFLYPGTGDSSETGRGEAKGTKVNVPLAPGSGDADVAASLPNLEAFARSSKPEFIILQGGADCLGGDPIAGLSCTRETHRRVASLLHKVSHEVCSGRMVALGGGGYAPRNCAVAWMAVVEALAG